MKHYKALDNSVHCIEPEFSHLLPYGFVEITQEEAEVLTQKTPAPDPKEAIRAQIRQMESEQLLPRATREYMLLDLKSRFTPAQLNLNFGYRAVKAFDEQIKALRAQL